MSNELQQGTIVFYAASKTYGFIRPDGTKRDEDVFFHLDNFDGDEPVLDTRVAFQVEADPKREGRKRAKSVVPISGQS
jgi:cold shock CspA family protein